MSEITFIFPTFPDTSWGPPCLCAGKMMVLTHCLQETYISLWEEIVGGDPSFCEWGFPSLFLGQSFSLCELRGSRGV